MVKVNTIEEILDEYENGQNPLQNEDYRLNKATKAIERLIIEGRIDELERLLFNKNQIEETIKRIAELTKEMGKP